MQFLGMLTYLKFPLPDFVDGMFSVVNVFNIDINFLS